MIVMKTLIRKGIFKNFYYKINNFILIIKVTIPTMMKLYILIMMNMEQTEKIKKEHLPY